MKKEFNEIIQTALEYTEPQEVFYTEYIALQLHALLKNQVTPASKILDIGSGHGLLTKLIQTLCDTRHVYGIDINADAVTFAQERYPSIQFQHTDALTIPFDDNFFDGVYMHVVLHHVPQEHHTHYVSEIFRVLKPGGIAIIIELNPYNIFVRKNFALNPYEQGLTMLQAAYTKKLCKQYGAVSVQYFGFFQQWCSLLRGLEPWLSWMPLGALYAVIVHKRSR